MPKPVRPRSRTLIGAVVVATGAALGGTVAYAVDPPGGSNSYGLSGSGFETLDGNTLAGDTGGTLDWDSLNKSSPADASTARLDNDKPSGSNDDSFGNGTKEDTAVPSVVSGGIPPNKSDLKEFGSWVEKNGNGQFLHLFWSRVQDPSGTTNMDFEFNQNICTPNASPPVTTGCSANGLTPARKAGDLLITYDLASGGSVAVLSYRTWSGSAWGASTAFDSSKAIGSINTGTITSTLTGNSYSPRTFGEASVNLALIFDSTTCKSFGGAYLKSRSSDSFTAATKDFIAPIGVDLTNCGRMVVNKRAGSASGPLLPGASFSVSPANNATPAVSSLSRVGGDSGVFCLDNLLLGTTYTLHESVVPSGYLPGTDTPFTPTLANAGGCGTVTTSSPADVTVVNTLDTRNIRITKTDDASPANPLTGASFTVYKDVAPLGGTAAGTEDKIGANVAGSCGPTTSAGTCTVSGIPLGSYWVVETTTPGGYVTAADQLVTLTSTSLATVPLTFVDAVQYKVITLVCKVSDNSLYGSTVTYDNGTGQATLTTAPGGTTAATLCGLGGATKTTARGSHSSSISIP